MTVWPTAEHPTVEDGPFRIPSRSSRFDPVDSADFWILLIDVIGNSSRSIELEH